jgi:hypothetical protein
VLSIVLCCNRIHTAVRECACSARHEPAAHTRARAADTSWLSVSTPARSAAGRPQAAPGMRGRTSCGHNPERNGQVARAARGVALMPASACARSGAARGAAAVRHGTARRGRMPARPFADPRPTQTPRAKLAAPPKRCVRRRGAARRSHTRLLRKLGVRPARQPLRDQRAHQAKSAAEAQGACCSRRRQASRRNARARPTLTARRAGLRLLRTRVPRTDARPRRPCVKIVRAGE